MAGIRNISASNTVPDDLAKRLTANGVYEILVVLWQGYRDLLLDPNISIDETAEEDDISQEWCGKISQKWYSKNRALVLQPFNLTPVYQYQDPTLRKKRGYKPTIDFCFRDWDTSNSYFGAECKNLYQNKPKKITRYVETGVKNYTSGRYGSQSSESALVAYVLSGGIPTHVNDLILEMSPEQPIENLNRELLYSDPQYRSKHVRTLDGQTITLHHLFFDFT